MNLISITAAAIAFLEEQTQAFCQLPTFQKRSVKQYRFSIPLTNNNIIVDNSKSSLENKTSIVSSENKENAALLKRELYQLAASYDRGFSATPRARAEANDIIEKLSALNPTTEASKGIDGHTNDKDNVPLRAIWRMVWTSALDVVSLGASPFAGKL